MYVTGCEDIQPNLKKLEAVWAVSLRTTLPTSPSSRCFRDKSSHKHGNESRQHHVWSSDWKLWILNRRDVDLWEDGRLSTSPPSWQEQDYIQGPTPVCSGARTEATTRTSRPQSISIRTGLDSEAAVRLKRFTLDSDSHPPPSSTRPKLNQLNRIQSSAGSQDGRRQI